MIKSIARSSRTISTSLLRPWYCTKCTSKLRLSTSTATNATPSAASFPEPSYKPFYVTSPIFYVNAAPHIGHLYSMILADVLKRWAVLRGHQAAALTIGTDEHGLKVQQSAFAAETDPQVFCDAGSAVIRHLAQQGDISYDYFARTTDHRHKEAVRYAWDRLKEAGYVYRDVHQGWYAVADETFYTDNNVKLRIDPITGRKRREATETGAVVEWTEEANYRFRLSAFQGQLLEFYESNPDWITPAPYMKQIVQEVKDGISDLSISRPTDRVQWGIPVPDDESQTIHVWLDALLNYAVQVGYPRGNSWGNGWPADVHVIGKDILRFHCIYWPAFLMALGVALPKRILSHAHWLMGKEKMSKSKGNVVNPFYLLDTYGPDIMRWHMVLDGGLADDADFNRSRLVTNYCFLSSKVGNFVFRILASQQWDVEKAVKQTWANDDALAKLVQNNEHAAMIEKLEMMRRNVDLALDSLDSKRALKEILSVFESANQWLTVCKPWVTARKKAETVDGHNAANHTTMTIGLAAEILRVCAIGLIPYMPGKASALLDEIMVDKDQRLWHNTKLGSNKTFGKSIIPTKAGRGKSTKGVLLFPPISESLRIQQTTL